MNYYEGYYTDFLRERVKVVTKAENEQEAREKIENSDKVVKSLNLTPISEESFNKFTKQYKAIE